MGNKKDKKKYYKNQTKSNKRFEELAGNKLITIETISGVLITTDKNKEKNSVRDAYNILNDAVEHLYPNLNELIKENELNELDAPKKKQKVSETESKVINNTNVSELLEDEINSLKKKTRLFYNFDTNCKGVVFIKLEKSVKDKIDIKRVCEYIINNVRNTKEQVSKSIARFIPIEVATKAKFDNFTKLCPQLLDKYFKVETSDTDKISWKLEIKVRNNNSICKDDYLNFAWNYIDKINFAVDYKNPKYTILVEITNDLLCMSVLEDYLDKKCYNLLTLSKTDKELQLERERLINKQKEAEKKKQDTLNKDYSKEGNDNTNTPLKKINKDEKREEGLKEEEIFENREDDEIQII
jgi:hypothetical protein